MILKEKREEKEIEERIDEKKERIDGYRREKTRRNKDRHDG